MWKSTEFIVLPHRDSKDVFILGGTDDIQVLLDDSQVSRETRDREEEAEEGGRREEEGGNGERGRQGGERRKEGVGKWGDKGEGGERRKLRKEGAKRGRGEREGDKTERRGREKKEIRGIGVFILAGLCCRRSHYFSECTLFSHSLSGEYLHHSRLPARGTHQVQGGRVGKTAQSLL